MSRGQVALAVLSHELVLPAAAGGSFDGPGCAGNGTAGGTTLALGMFGVMQGTWTSGAFER